MRNPYNQPRQIRSRNRETLLEKTMRLVLEAEGIRYLTQFQIGMYHVDFFLPDSGVVLEVDGERWHPTEEKAQKSVIAAHKYAKAQLRDRTLAERGYHVEHIWGNDLRRDARGCLIKIRKTIGRPL